MRRVAALGTSLLIWLAASSVYAQESYNCIGWNSDLTIVPHAGSTAEAESVANQIVADINKALGRFDPVKVVAVDMEGACAMRGEQGNKIIYFGSSWLEKYSAGNPWIKTGVLAHELGHHLNDHKPSLTDGWRQEYEADQFLGHVVKLLGGSLSDALIVAATEPETGHDHPNREIRELAIKSGYGAEGSGSQTEAQMTATAIAALPNLQTDRARALLLRAERAFRTSSPSPEDGRALAAAILKHHDSTQSGLGTDPDLPAIVQSLNSAPTILWGQSDSFRNEVRSMLASMDLAAGAGHVLPPVSTSARSELSRKVGYFVPPDRLVEAAPFRARVSYCAGTSCTIRFVLHGYDVRGNLRYDSSEQLLEMRQGEFRDTRLGTNERMYFNAEDLSRHPTPIRFKLFCIHDRRVIEGGTELISWRAVDEALSGHTQWLSCDSPGMSAGLGVAVNATSFRQSEPTVKAAPMQFILD